MDWKWNNSLIITKYCIYQNKVGQQEISHWQSHKFLKDVISYYFMGECLFDFERLKEKNKKGSW